MALGVPPVGVIGCQRRQCRRVVNHHGRSVNRDRGLAGGKAHVEELRENAQVHQQNLVVAVEVAPDGIFVEIGADPRLEIPNQLQLQINKETGEVHVDKHQKTSQSGIYAAGDLTDGTDLKQTITAASQGAIAALSAYQNVSQSQSFLEPHLDRHISSV